MRVSWKIGDGRSLILSIVVFVGAGICIYEAREFASTAPSERTTTAHVVSVKHHIFRYLRFNFYNCTYNFSVDGTLYAGLSDCPQGIADDAVKGKYSDSAGASTGVDATVYYDPADPSINSLLEFSAASENSYQFAAPWIDLGVIIILLFVFGAVLEANKNRGKGGAFVDARGTVVYPEEIGFSTGFGGLPSGRRTAEESYADDNGQAAKTTDFASSWGLRELYLDVVKQIHPDHASNEADQLLRERLTKEANAAYERGDDATLRKVLEEYRSTISATCQNTI
ncbi:MAG: hypothetical protein ABR924_04915 [Terracidiphilus sp.]|jgi:hypothetical protein